MNLSRVIIKNFRSIAYQEIKFDIPFRILVGKNESGKSNILKALSFLDLEKEIQLSDIRQSLEVDEDELSCQITFEFKLDADETNENYIKVKEKILYEENVLEELKIVKIADNEYTLKELCKYFSVGVYWIDFNKNKRFHNYWSYNKNWNMISKDLLYNPYSTTNKNSSFNRYRIVDKNNLSEDEKKNLLEINGEQLHALIGAEVGNTLKAKHPRTIVWEYQEKDLLTDQINIDEFISEPDNFKPLKTMFELAGISKIKELLDKLRQANNYHKLNDFLEKIANKTTKHFISVWNEYSDIGFTLNVNGDYIVTGIKESNTFTFQQRSDGFKRFVTFLLMISAVYETDGLQDAVILIDEPDVSLHPSGIKYLRDELIKISKHNYVVASTHSIFLIDQKNINRHYIIEKKNEVTTITEANDTNLITEEVLYNALGFSFYEILKKENLIFEGWRDKELFRKALERVPAEFKEIKDNLKDIGVAHINGVKEGQSITPIFELTGRKLIIISDSDEVANQHKKLFEKNNSYGFWQTYKDIDPKFEALTGEDFLKVEYHKMTIQTFKKIHPELSGEPNFQEDVKGFLKTFEKWLKDECSIAEKSSRNELINNYKDILFNNLKNSNIDHSYYELLIGLNKKMPDLFSDVKK